MILEQRWMNLVKHTAGMYSLAYLGGGLINWRRAGFMDHHGIYIIGQYWSRDGFICQIWRWYGFDKKNPAYGRHQLSRPMQIVGPIQFWRGCVIYRSAPKSGLCPRENADSVHAKVGTRSTQKCWLGSLRNTSPFLGLYLRLRSRLRSNSGTHPHF